MCKTSLHYFYTLFHYHNNKSASFHFNLVFIYILYVYVPHNKDFNSNTPKL